MARYIKLRTTKTYASIENAIKAVEKKFPESNNDGLTYIVIKTEDNRYYPVFLGERAMHAGVHFHFHVAG
jgi:hypothetical protein